jgi:MFS family permease
LSSEIRVPENFNWKRFGSNRPAIKKLSERRSQGQDLDRIAALGPQRVGVLVVADLVLATAAGFASLAAGVSLWGLHMGLSQGLLAALVADAAPPDRRGTAFGLFNLVSGIVLLFASFLAGVLWDHFGPQALFYAAAVFATLAFFGTILQIRS